MRVSRKNPGPEKPKGEGEPRAHTPHDALFRFTFGQVEHAGPAIAAMLPPAVVAKIDFSTLETAKGQFVDPELLQSHTDLLFTATIAGRPGKIYVLFEHQSSPEHLMILRLLRYLLRIWDDYVRQNPQTKTLPVILPLVVHHSESGWTSPVRFEELLDIDGDDFADVAEFVPRFGMVLHDISDVTDEELMERALTAMARVTLFLLRYTRSAKSSRELFGRLVRYGQLVDEVFHAPNGADAHRAVLRYIQGVTKESAKEIRMAMREADLIDEETYWDIRHPAWREERAHQKGVEEGIEQGIEKGHRSILLKLLSERFGEVPAWATERVNSASLAALEQMMLKILRAQTITDVVGTKGRSTAARKPKTRTGKLRS